MEPDTDLHEPQDWIAASQPGAPVEGSPLFSYPSRASLVPPRLVPTERPLPRPEGSITLAAEEVHARVRELTTQARTTGQLHTLRLWRDGIHQAIDTLTRTALRLPDDAVCDDLSWELTDGVYHVTARYHLPSSVLLH